MLLLRKFFSIVVTLCLLFIAMPAYSQILPDLEKAAEAYSDKLMAAHGKNNKRSGILSFLNKKDPEASTDNDFKTLGKLYDAGDYEGAVKLIEQILRQEDGRSDLWLILMKIKIRAADKDDFYYTIPSDPAFWDPLKNELLLSGYNGLLTAQTNEDKRIAYTQLYGFLGPLNQHPDSQALRSSFLKIERALLQRAESKKVFTGDNAQFIRMWRDELESSARQSVSSHKINENGNLVSVCVAFAHELPLSGINFDDYIKIAPGIEFTTRRAADKNLCIDGLDYGQSYELTVKAGLKSSAEEISSLADNYQVQIFTEDRQPMAKLSSDRNILARTTLKGVPVTTVNVEHLKVRIVKAISKRALPSLVGEMDYRLRGYRFERLFTQTGEPLWQGEMDIVSQKNKETVTYFPIEEILNDVDPGVFALEVEYIDSNGDKQSDRQFLFITDIGLSSMTASNGLQIVARSFANAKPLPGIKLSLISKSNSILAEGQTGKDGTYMFPAPLLNGKAGFSPLMVMAQKNSDFSTVRLDKPAFDLSDRGVGGRKVSGLYEAYVYSERGVYRPGDAVHIVTIARDKKGDALSGLPLMIVLERPDGVESIRKNILDLKAGGFEFNVDLPKNARMGMWKVEVFADPEGEAIGSARFRVEEYVPPKIEVSITRSKTPFESDFEHNIVVKSNYLYGAPAKELNARAEIIVVADAEPFPDFKEFHFGLSENADLPKKYELDSSKTDAQGTANFSALIEKSDLENIYTPLSAKIRATVFEKGGRSVSALALEPLKHKAQYIGIKVSGVKETGDLKKTVEFNIVVVDHDGEKVPLKDVQYSLYKVSHNYNWYRTRNGWGYRRSSYEDLLSTNLVDIKSGAALKIITDQLDSWHEYRVELSHTKSKTVSDLVIKSLWGNQDDDKPDTIQISAVSKSVEAGKTVEVFIKPPYAGEAVVTLADNAILKSEHLYIPEEGTTYKFEMNEDWGSGVYALVNLVRPLGSNSQTRGGTRAIGVKWIAINNDTKKLDVHMDVPEVITPRQKISIPLKIDDVPDGEKVFVSIAAVDEGILQLTNYKSPDPYAFFNVQRWLGVDIRDIYGSLIQGGEGFIGNIRSGGGAGESSSAADMARPGSYVKSVSLFSGILEVDKKGNAVVDLEIPDFNGKLRLMATAYSKSKLGAVERDLIVRDPVVVEESLPRFLAPEDQTQLSLRIHNIDGSAGRYKLNILFNGAVVSDAENNKSSFKLAKNEEKIIVVPFKALARAGSAKVSLTLSGPNSLEINKVWSFDVRPHQILNTKSLFSTVDPGEEFEVTELSSSFWPGTVKASMVMSPEKTLDVQSLVDSLSLYPYGCTEQTVSKALPLLFVDDLQSKWGVSIDASQAALKGRVQRAVNKVQNNMNGDGGFGYWNWRDDSNIWLSAYATDFLALAKKQGYYVSTYALEKAIKHLKSEVSYPRNTQENLSGNAYAIYVLAREKQINPGQVRYFYDTYSKKIEKNWPLALLGSALKYVGEQERAEKAFTKALDYSAPRNQDFWYYGSNLRDSALVLSTLLEHANTLPGIDDIINSILSEIDEKKYFSTQEQAWLVRAALNLSTVKDSQISYKLGNSLDQQVSDKPVTIDPLRNNGTVQKITNTGSDPIFIRLSLLGSLKDNMEVDNNGYNLTRRYYNIDGSERIMDRPIVQNDLLVVVVEGSVVGDFNRSHENLFIDMLPAGFEIENMDLGASINPEEFLWLFSNAEVKCLDKTSGKISEVTADMCKGNDLEITSILDDDISNNLTPLSQKEQRDDRFIASFRGGNDAFRIVYFVRAVTPGSYTLPGAYIEDMYHPDLFARSATTVVSITDAK